MSKTVFSAGWYAPLFEPITDPKRIEELNELFYDSGSHIRLSDNGTYIFSDVMLKRTYSERGEYWEVIAPDQVGEKWFGESVTDFTNEHFDFVDEHGGVDGINSRRYCLQWWNGSDNPMNGYTLDHMYNLVK